MNPKANLFLIGAAKGGTTALAKWLSEQGEVFTPAIKEPSYFGSDLVPEEFSEEYAKRVKLPKNYFSQNPLPDLHMTFLRESSQYEALFADSDSYPYRMDSSTVYLTSSLAAQEIYDYNPKAKVVVILRDPAYRAYSHYLMGVQMGLISSTFEKAWEKDLLTVDKGIGKSEMIVETGLYGENLKRFYEVFPKDQICVLLHEHFSQMTQKFLDTLQDFLGFELKDQKASRENVSSETKYKNLNKWIKGNSALHAAKQVLSPKVVKRVKNLMTQDVRPLSAEMRSKLIDFYLSDIEQTEILTGLDLTQWKE